MILVLGTRVRIAFVPSVRPSLLSLIMMANSYPLLPKFYRDFPAVAIFNPEHLSLKLLVLQIHV